MPVVGLPTVLESALVALLNEKLLRSWKIRAGYQNTIVVIRLATEPQRDSTAVTQCSYRHGPPSQLRRDTNRAEEFQQKKLSSLQENQANDANIDTVFETNFFLSTPPVSQTDISVQACDTPVSTFTARDTRPQTEVGQTSDKGKLVDNVNTFGVLALKTLRLR